MARTKRHASKEALLKLADELGIELEFKVSFVKEKGGGKWLHRQNLYNKLYMQKRMGGI